MNTSDTTTVVATTESPVKRAAKTARAVQKGALTRIFKASEGARNELDNILPIERKQAEGLLTIANNNSHKVKVLAAMQVSGDEYREFPTEAFGWRNEEKIPELIPFPIGQDTVTYNSHWANRRNGNGSVPASVRGFYSDVDEMLWEALTAKNVPFEKANYRRGMTTWFGGTLLIWTILYFIPSTTVVLGVKLALGFVGFLLSMLASAFTSCKYDDQIVGAYQIQAVFNGLIPEPIRQKIRRAQALGVFQEIFILTEVPGLKIEATDAPRMALVGDPLVIGFDGSGFWLIAAFDTTAVEAMALATNPDQTPVG